MTVDRVTDGKRIAQLLASELSGLERGPLDAVTVTDPDPDATPTADGTPAYRVRHHEEPVATVALYPGHATVRLEEGSWAAPPGRVEAGADGLRVEDGAAVKDAVDALATVVGDR